MEKLLLKNVDLFTPEHIGICNLLLENGKVLDFGPNVDDKDAYALDGSGLKACPAFVDGQVHFLSKINFSTQDFLSAGVCTAIGVTDIDPKMRNLEMMFSVAEQLTSQCIDSFVLTDGFNIYNSPLTGDIEQDILNLEPIIGAKSAINSKFLVRISNPNFSAFKELALKCYRASLVAQKPIHILVQLENDPLPDSDNLEWIDRIVDETKIPYSLFKLTHAQNYPERALEYAKKGCFVDFVAFSGEFDEGFAPLVKSIQDGSLPADRISISSDGFGLAKKDGNYKFYNMPIYLLTTFKVLVKEQKLPFESVLKMLTSTPGCVVDPSYGRIQKGELSKIITLDDNFNVKNVINFKNSENIHFFKRNNL